MKVRSGRMLLAIGATALIGAGQASAQNQQCRDLATQFNSQGKQHQSMELEARRLQKEWEKTNDPRTKRKLIQQGNLIDLHQKQLEALHKKRMALHCNA